MYNQYDKQKAEEPNKRKLIKASLLHSLAPLALVFVSYILSLHILMAIINAVFGRNTIEPGISFYILTYSVFIISNIILFFIEKSSMRIQISFLSGKERLYNEALRYMTIRSILAYIVFSFAVLILALIPFIGRITMLKNIVKMTVSPAALYSLLLLRIIPAMSYTLSLILGSVISVIVYIPLVILIFKIKTYNDKHVRR